MKTSEIARPALLLWVMFIAVDLIARVIFPTMHAVGPYVLAWSFGANAIVAVTVAILASRAPWQGLRLALALSVVPLAIQVSSCIEGMVFLKTDKTMWWGLALSPLKYVLIVPLWLMISRQPASLASNESAIPARTIGGKLWRFVFCDFIYLILYFVAGLLIFPLVRGFYATRVMPSIGQVVALQLFLRGPVFVGICVLLSRMIGSQRLTTALAVGLAFTLISGVAPLIVPNQFFPDAVRWVHFCEVTSSNFVFGVLVALIWWRKQSSGSSNGALGGKTNLA